MPRADRPGFRPTVLLLSAVPDASCHRLGLRLESAGMSVRRQPLAAPCAGDPAGPRRTGADALLLCLDRRIDGFQAQLDAWLGRIDDDRHRDGGGPGPALIVCCGDVLTPAERLCLLRLGVTDVLGPEASDDEVVLRVGAALSLRRLQQRLTRHDGLTGLVNRTEFLRRVELILRSLRRHPAAARAGAPRRRLMLIDLDQFKQVNDHFGTDGGDEILRQVAGRLDEFVARHGGADRRRDAQPSPWAARIDSDRFMVLVPGAPGDTPHDRCIEDIRSVFAAPFHLHEPVPLTATIGVATFPDDGQSADELVRQAETAVATARQRGHGTVQFFDGASPAGRADWAFQNDLRLAIERDELSLLYQPQVDASSHRIVSVEALLRWDHPRHGPVSPSTFVPIAEQSGLLDLIGNWVIDRACAQIARWHRADVDLSVAVNLSASQFMRGDVTGVVAAALAHHGVPGSSLTFELTEGVLADHDPALLEALNGLKRLGGRLSLDDFGTGYSAMGYLKRFPVDEIKVDRSFVHDLPHRRSSRAIVDAILSLARGLDLQVVVEGVENEAQLRALRAPGRRMLLQGTLFGQPMPAADIARMARAAQPLLHAPRHGVHGSA